MSLEANIVEQLQELRKWQQQQQEELMRRQKEQIQQLSCEQTRVYEALSSSIDDEQSLKELIQSHKKKNGVEEVVESNLIDLDTPDDEDDENECNATEKSQDSSHIDLLHDTDYDEDSISETPRGQLAIECNNDSLMPSRSYNSSFSLYTSTDLIPEDMRSLCSNKSQRSILIDDLPVPSPKKDFSTLLEEKLRDSEAVKFDNAAKPVVKRPFLKKGQGLARFRPKPKSNDNKTCPARSRSVSFSSATQSSASKSSKSENNGRYNSVPKIKKHDTKTSFHSANVQKNILSSKSGARKSISPLLPQKLNFKNVPLPQRKVDNRISNAQQSRKAILDKKKPPVITLDVSNSDLEGKTKKELEEVRIFELLEDKAENSSFCSTSSTVIAFMQQSTPLKQKALLHSATKHQISLNNVGDQTLEEIVSNTESNNLVAPMVQNNNNDQHISQWEVMSMMKNNKSGNKTVLPYGTDIDMHYDKNSNQESNLDQNNASLHVRFAEYNEYKTLSDSSSVSSESGSVRDYNTHGVWSDHSGTPDTSDIESIPQKLKAIGLCNNGKACNSFSCMAKETEDSEYEDEESQNPYNQENGKESRDCTEDDYEDDAESKNDTITSVDTVIEKDEGKSLFKSELVRKRLLELEHEIEVFRKESAALINLKQKLQEERTQLHEERIKMQRFMKEKETTLEAEKRRTESNLMDEKKRLAREKAALENRMKDAYEKALKCKQERHEIQVLREQVEELREESEQKESKWSAMAARQRCQIRVLQSENAKLKQEIEQLLQKQKERLKRAVNSNTRAIHQIGKSLADRKKVSPDKNEEPSQEDKSKKAPHATNVNYDLDLDIMEEKPREVKKVKIPKTLESIARTRNLYEMLLRDATEDFREIQIGEKPFLNQMHDIQKPREEEKEEEENDDDDDDKDTQNKARFTKEGPVDREETSDEGCAVDVESQEQVQSNSHKTNWKTKTDQPKPAMNKQAVREIRHSDGRMELWYPNGNVKKVFPDKGLTKMIYYNGDVRETNQDGVVKYFYAVSRTWHTTMPDGLEILEFPDGQVERKSKDGTLEITFADGSVRIVQADGTDKWAMKDGTIAETTADGDRILTLPNGQREIHTKDHKRREYPDGTVKLLYADGTQETRYASGRIRLKDKDGNLLMDTHQ
ncbi:centromere protein J isoform X2 [Copidosoma floridanum]|uniref:centromere protein J isoform X2 n=1 Tax=Copidosoma floridanum TaxID=29053 RepID=UPI0006C9C5F7|nr:centromere protein J isoform X2 [Copidosoma floridanum]